jgi:DNA polymerase-3 subunit alpha
MHEIVPIETRVDPEDKTKRVPVSAFDMNDAAEAGLLKFDFLGLNTLTVIHDCVDLIKERHGVNVDWENLEPDDSSVLGDLNNAHTVGVFQMESSPYRKLLAAMGVDSFEDLVASNALVRPGAFLTVAQDYIKRKKGLEKVSYPTKECEEWLRDTYGVYIYQEQVMALTVVLADFPWSKADKLRKIIGKKLSPDEFAPYFQPWIEIAGGRIGIPAAEKMWHDFEKHSGYSFNRSHAVAYSYLGYVTAWLKHYYPLEFIYSLLRNEKKDTTKMTYLLEARRLGIKILPPDVNNSEKDTSVEGDALRFGLNDIKGVGFVAAKHLIERRPFTSWVEFNEKIEPRKCNSKVIEALVSVDAFASISDAPHISNPEKNYQERLNYPVALEEILDLGIEFQDLAEYDEDDGFALICAVVKDIKRTNSYVRLELEDLTGNTTVFGTMSNDLATGEVIIALIGDRSMIGYCRADGLQERIRLESLSKFEEFLFGDPFKDVEILRSRGLGKIGDDKALVIPLQVKAVTTKAGKRMAFMYLSDGQDIIKVTVFPAVWEHAQKEFFDWVPMAVKLSMLDDGGFTIWKDGFKNARQIKESWERKIKSV